MLGHDLTGALPELRRHAESRMGSINGASEATVSRYVTGVIIDPSAGETGDRFEVIHAGPMRLASVASLGPSRTVSVPGGEVSLATRRADFPIGTPRFRDGDVIEVTAGENVGSRWVVIEADSADARTAYRVPVVAHQGA